MLVQPRWWDGVMALGLIACGVLLGTSSPFNRDPISWAVLAAFALVYVLLARPQFALPHGPAHPRLIACAGLVAALIAVGVYRYPALATLQCVAYPLVWTLPWRLRAATVANLAIGVAVMLGYGLSPVNEGASPWIVGLGVAVLSVAFSLVLGIWITRIAEYGADRARLLAELTAAQGELAAMHREAGELAERTRFARELHDTVTQSLTGLVMLAERAGAQLDSGRVGEAQASVSLIESTARDALGEARALVATMSPVSGEGLGDALHRLAARFERETGVTVAVELCERHLTREQEVVLLRCAQGGLANVRKHAHAAHVVIAVGADEASGELALTVRDDGVGVGAAAGDGDAGFGVAGMRERVGMLGGRLSLTTPSGGGAELAVVIPLAVS
ncbi:sensor histidine kinase [Gryllotalpicola daejeonensis]|uniref:Oxygen sensor histidine kinase NreB n=1 Tax=Gryllotalpicola daejeonensis TaxID=993087 RepID=A0ABP7ZKE1_9MICO